MQTGETRWVGQVCLQGLECELPLPSRAASAYSVAGWLFT